MARLRKVPEPLAWLRSLAERCGFLDSRCLLCGTVRTAPVPRQEQADQLCPDCQLLLAPRLGGFCPQCGAMHGEDPEPIAPCNLCLQRASGQFAPLPWQRLHFYAPYSGVLRACILAYKMRGRLGLGALLQGLMLAGLLQNAQRTGAEGAAPDIIVPVPLHPKRLRQRGFNQSIELARPLARHLDIPLAASALRRIRPTTPQFQLQLSLRAQNIKGAFAAAPELAAGARVLLVDDIMTTGATLEECARVLQLAGASRVDVLVLARTGRG